MIDGEVRLVRPDAVGVERSQVILVGVAPALPLVVRMVAVDGEFEALPGQEELLRHLQGQLALERVLAARCFDLIADPGVIVGPVVLGRKEVAEAVPNRRRAAQRERQPVVTVVVAGADREEVVGRVADAPGGARTALLGHGLDDARHGRAILGVKTAGDYDHRLQGVGGRLRRRPQRADQCVLRGHTVDQIRHIVEPAAADVCPAAASTLAHTCLQPDQLGKTGHRQPLEVFSGDYSFDRHCRPRHHLPLLGDDVNRPADIYHRR